MKLLIAAIFEVITKFFMKIPFHFVRRAYLRLFLGKLGKNCTISRNVELRCLKNIFIDDNSIINKNVLLDGRGGKLEIGQNVDVAQDVYIWTSQHDYNDDYHSLKNAGVKIHDYAWIGARSNILPGVIINKGAVIGTCSVVTKDVETMSVVAGIPAKKISNRESKLLYKLKHRPYFE